MVILIIYLNILQNNLFLSTFFYIFAEKDLTMKKTKEEWKKFNDFIEVSNLGNVRSLDRYVEKHYKNKTVKNFIKGKILKPNQKDNGYYMIHLRHNYKIETYSAHRLVALLFCEIPEHLKDIHLDNLEVDHINGDKSDNRAENLRWVTHKENMNNPITYKKWRKIMSSEKTRKKLRGKVTSEKTKKKLSESLKNHPLKSKQVYQYSLNGELIAIYQSAKEAARQNGFSQGNICVCCNGGYFSKQRNKCVNRLQYKGYKWSYNPL